ncbi:hypothetical protein LTR33_015656 [Friedmanniomyces endolithicus]|nr:hypothetical protein LTR33_015656 [Friedmanniomyces endolithicus]
METFIEHIFHLELFPTGLLPALADDAGILEAAARISSPRHDDRAKKASIKTRKHKRKTINATNHFMMSLGFAEITRRELDQSLQEPSNVKLQIHGRSQKSVMIKRTPEGHPMSNRNAHRYLSPPLYMV